MPRMYRQGDVLVVERTNKLPKSAKMVARDRGRVILAYGEVTGHAHAIMDSTVTKLADGIAEFLQAPNGCQIAHEEHDTITLPPGDYEIVHQREYAPNEIKYVLD